MPRSGEPANRHGGKQARLEAVIAKLKTEGYGFDKLDASGTCS